MLNLFKTAENECENCQNKPIANEQCQNLIYRSMVAVTLIQFIRYWISPFDF